MRFATRVTNNHDNELTASSMHDNSGIIALQSEHKLSEFSRNSDFYFQD